MSGRFAEHPTGTFPYRWLTAADLGRSHFGRRVSEPGRRLFTRAGRLQRPIAAGAPRCGADRSVSSLPQRRPHGVGSTAGREGCCPSRAPATTRGCRVAARWIGAATPTSPTATRTPYSGDPHSCLGAQAGDPRDGSRSRGGAGFPPSARELVRAGEERSIS